MFDSLKNIIQPQFFSNVFSIFERQNQGCNQFVLRVGVRFRFGFGKYKSIFATMPIYISAIKIIKEQMLPSSININIKRNFISDKTLMEWQ